MNRVALLVVLAAVLSACGSGSPDGSYIFPTAIIGIPVQSQAEAEIIQAAVAEFSKRHDLRVYRPSDQPPFPGSDGDAERQRGTTYYLPSQPAAMDGFSIRIRELSSACITVELSERSHQWTRASLVAFEDLTTRLSEVTESRSEVMVRPKQSQNYPEQNSQVDSERPVSLEDLCVRMGVPDPRVTDEAA